MINDTKESVSQELYGKPYKELLDFTVSDPPDGGDRQRTVELELMRRWKVFYENKNEEQKGLIGYLTDRLTSDCYWDDILKYVEDVCGEDFRYYEYSNKFIKEQLDKEEEADKIRRQLEMEHFIKGQENKND